MRKYAARKSFMVSVDVKERIRAAAAARGISMSELIRRALEWERLREDLDLLVGTPNRQMGLDNGQ